MRVRHLLSTIGIAIGGLLASAGGTAAADGGAGAATLLETPIAELAIAPPTDHPNIRLSSRGANGRVTFSPVDPRRLAVAIASNLECYVKTSADGGKTWGGLVPLPRLPGTDCTGLARPVVTYATNGRLLYAASRYEKHDAGYTTGVAVSVSTDHGATWSAPKSVFERPEDYDSTGVCDLHLVVAPDGPRVYVFTLFCGYHSAKTYLMSAVDQGRNWSAPKEITYSFLESLYGDWLEFSWAVGHGGVILVARGFWKDNSEPAVYFGKSTDQGTTITYDIVDYDSELWLDDPDIKIGSSGTAHLVYRKGDGIFYKFSLPPYGAWSAATVRLNNDDPQGSAVEPRLAIGACALGNVLHVTWVEALDQTQPGAILYARRVARPGYAWSEPLKVGRFIPGEWSYLAETDLAAAGSKAFAVFTKFPNPRDPGAIVGSRISSGIPCQ